MSDFSTAYSDIDDALASVKLASEALSSNLDPTKDADLIARLLSATESLLISDQDTGNALAEEQSSIGTATTDGETTSEDLTLLATVPIKLTSSSGNERPRMAIDNDDNIWMAWHSSRTGTEEIYVAKYFGGCGAWSIAGVGGEEVRITNFGTEGRRSLCPNIAVGSDGEAHIVWQTQSETGTWDIYYSKSTGGGIYFPPPMKISDGNSNSLMPDVAVFSSDDKDVSGAASRVVVVWHDDRFGNFEIMAAERYRGSWRSSGQGSSDIRITQAAGDSMFPKIDSDNRGNLRVVYHDSRRSEDLVGIYMSTFVGSTEKWESSGQGRQDQLISNSPADARHPDLAIDHTGGISVAWHDFRHAVEDPDQHEEIYALYCVRVGHPGVHYPPLQPNVETRLDVDFEIKECVNFKAIDMTNAPEVCLSIRAPNATFWRAANEDGEYSAWQEFKPNYDIETMVVPWTLICVGGTKSVCVQVQDAEMVGFPICKEVTLALQPPEFKVEFFEDEAMSVALPAFDGLAAAKQGNVFVKLTTESPQILSPNFDVISSGQGLIFNQETERVDVGTEVQSAGIGSFIGGTTVIDNNVSPAALAFYAAAGRVFRGRFNVHCHDGLLNMDGLARVVVHPRDVCGAIKSNAKQETATEIVLSKSATVPDLDTDNPSNQIIIVPRPEPPPYRPPEDREDDGSGGEGCDPLDPCVGTTGSVDIAIGVEYDEALPNYTTITTGSGGIQTCEGSNTSYVTSVSQQNAITTLGRQAEAPGFSCGSPTARMFSAVYAFGEGFTLEHPSFLTEITLKLAFTYFSGGAGTIWDPSTVNKSECLFVIEIHRMLATYKSQLIPGTSIPVSGDEFVEYDSLPSFGLSKVWNESSKWTRTGLHIRLCAGYYYLVVRSGRPFVGQPGALSVGLTTAGGDRITHAGWYGPGGPFGIIAINSWSVWDPDDCKEIDWRDQWGRESHHNKNYHMYTRMKFEG